MSSPGSDAVGRLVLVRHGATAWSRSGQHTGSTDLPLLPDGEQDAYAVGRALAGHAFALVLSSPLERARRTAELAGFSPMIDPGLVEWDYGGYEGLTTVQIRERAQADWTVFAHGVVPGDTPGETLEEVAERCRRVLARIAPVLATDDVLVVAHGHLLRVLAACYLDVPPATGAGLLLDAGSISVLEEEKGVRAIRVWNLTPERSFLGGA
jgi:broad specificity phosphatase PhoE